MSSIDDTKKKLNIDELDSDSRNKMFNKFIEKGGKIIEEKKPKTIVKKDRFVLIKEKELSTRRDFNRIKTENKFSSGKNENKEKKIKKYFSVYTNGILQGIFNFNEEFSKKFSNNILEEFIVIINDISYFLAIFIDTAGDRKWKNVDIINSYHQYGYEILIRLNDLNNNERMEKLKNFFQFRQKIICTPVIKDIIKIFKSLFILFPYWETSKEILWKAVELYKFYTAIDPVITKAKINKSIDRIFSYYFPRLLTIINYNLGQKISYEYRDIKSKLHISNEEEMGFISSLLIKEKKEFIELLKKQKEEAIKKMQQEIEKKELEKIPKFIQKGLAIIENIVKRIPLIKEKDSKLNLFDNKEKMLEFYAIFQEFDLEYSFILTTSQIKFNQKLEAGKRIDIKQDFDELYVRFNEINSFIREYFELLNELVKIKVQSRGQGQHFETSIENITKKMLITFNEIKARSSTFFNKFSIILQEIIQDYNSEKRLLQNPEQKVSFELEKATKRKFEGTTIINAILYAFSFSSAIHFYITNGKLSGKGLYINNEDIKKPDNEIEENLESLENPVEENNTEIKNPLDEDEENKSVE